MEIISVNIQKGGCGKTTTCQMLAEILGKDYGKRVLCVDTDPQCNLTTVAGLDLMECQDRNLYTLLNGKHTASDCIMESDYYDIIPGSLFLAAAETEFLKKLDRERLLKSKLARIEGYYDIVLIDTPPSLGLLCDMALTACTKVLIPTECSYLSMIGLNQLYGRIQEIQESLNPELSILGILLIKYNDRTNLNRAVYDGLIDMASRMSTDVFNSKIRETIKIREAQSQQSSILKWDASCSAVQDYKCLVNELSRQIF